MNNTHLNYRNELQSSMDIIVWDCLLQICLNGPSLGTKELISLIKEAISIGFRMGLCSADGTFGASDESVAMKRMKRRTVNARKDNTEYQKRKERKNLRDHQFGAIKILLLL